MIPHNARSSSPILLVTLALCGITPASMSCKPSQMKANPDPAQRVLPDFITMSADAPLQISPPARPPVPWLEPAATQLVTPRLGPGPMIVFGEHVSLHRTSHGMIAVHARDGVIGPVELPPKSTWVGVDGEDHIWVGRFSDGKVWRAQSASAARTAEAFVEVMTIPGARAWDASGPYVAIATAEAITLSTDHGATWKERKVAGLDRILQIYVRGDGVIVAQGENEASRELDLGLPSTWISTNRGISWALSPYQPGKLERDGTWIWSGDSTCVATLTDDGKAWSANPDLSGLPGEHDPREHMLSLTYTLHAPSRQAQIATTLTPSAPRNAPPLHQGIVATCQDPIMSGVMREEPFKMPGQERGPRLDPCQHGACLRGFTLEPTRSAHEMYLLADAQCQWPEGISPQQDPACRAQGARVERVPHLVLWDRSTDSMEMDVMPEGCTPERILNTRGLHVLLCRAGEETNLWTRSATTRWAQEAILDRPAHTIAQISSSEDGTIVLHGACTPDACEPSYIRQPRASGIQELWAAIEVPQSLTVLPLNAGHAIVASLRGDDTTSISLWFVEQGVSLTPLLDIHDIEEPVYALSTTNNSSNLLLHLGDPLTSRRVIVRGDGGLNTL